MLRPVSTGSVAQETGSVAFDSNDNTLKVFTGVEVFGPSNDKQLMIGQHWVAYMGDTIDPDESVVATNRSPMQAYQMLRKRIAKHMMSQL